MPHKSYEDLCGIVVLIGGDSSALSFRRQRLYWVIRFFDISSDEYLVNLIVIDVHDLKGVVSVDNLIGAFRNFPKHIHHEASYSFISGIFRQFINFKCVF